MLALTAAGGVLLVEGARPEAPAAAPLPGRTFSVAPAPGARVDAAGAHPRKVPAVPAPPVAVPAAVLPSRVYVPSLGIDGGWVGEPVSAAGLAIPSDVHQIGLSLAGGQPGGATGTVLLASHVNYVGQGPGVLASLYRIQPGALVIVTDHVGHPSRWRVTGLDDPLKPDLNPDLFSAAGPRRLALITCGGKVEHGQYERNVVATAVPETTWTSS